MSYVVVAAGGAIGAVLRYVLMNLVGTRNIFGLHLPYGTLAVNILGSFLMGVMIEYIARHVSGSQHLHLFFAVGILGSFTTFSTFSLDVIVMMQRGEMTQMAVYIIGSVMISIVALFLGISLIRAIV